MKKFDIITIFPKILDSYFSESLFKRAEKNKLLEITTHNLRDWTTDRHQTVDDKPYGGGVGLLFKIEPIYKALKKIARRDALQCVSTKDGKKNSIILTAANGKRFTQKDALRLSKYKQLVFVCPRYEGVDARVEKLVDEKISIGDYVLAGGELPAAIIVEAVARHIPGFVGKQESVANESHTKEGYLEHPHYTRPEVFTTKEGKKLRVPKVLLSGHHGEVEKWREKKSKTRQNKNMEDQEKNKKTEREVSIAMEDELREVRAKQKQPDQDSKENLELKKQEKELLVKISRRARKMLRQREDSEKMEDDAFRSKLIKHFNEKEGIAPQLEILIEKITTFMSQAGDYFLPEQQKNILSALAACGEINDKETLVGKIMEIVAPVIELQKNNLKRFEKIQRQNFSDREEEKFIPIEGTDNIIQYGMASDRIHLHLAPMRTLSTSEKIKFIKEVMPAAMKNLAQVLKGKPEIKSVTATSYIVAASQELFRNKIGFTKIGPMKKEYRLGYFGDCDMPVLRAAITREEFLQKWGQQ